MPVIASVAALVSLWIGAFVIASLFKETAAKPISLLSMWNHLRKLRFNQTRLKHRSRSQPLTQAKDTPSSANPWQVISVNGEENIVLRGLPAVARWVPVVLADDFADRLPTLAVGDHLQVQPFADTHITARVFSTKPTRHGWAINARPLGTDNATLFIELNNNQPQRPVMRLDQQGASMRWEVAWHPHINSLIAIEFNKLTEKANRLIAAEKVMPEDAHVCGAGCSHGAPKTAQQTEQAGAPAMTGGPDFEWQDLPASNLRNDFSSLADKNANLPLFEGEKPLQRALTYLRENPIPAPDVNSLRLDDAGDFYYACHGLQILENVENNELVIETDIEFPVAATVPLLHSHPSQTKYILHIDFDGEVLGSNIRWDQSFGQPSDLAGEETKPYGGDSNFSSNELGEIAAIWEMSAEAFSAYELNVTTEYPGVDTLFVGHNIVTEGQAISGAALPHNNAGGVAYLSVLAPRRTHQIIRAQQLFHGRKIMGEI